MINMLKSVFGNKNFLIALPWIIVVVGGGLLAYSTFVGFESVKWQEFWKSTGGILLTGGIFAALLKSFQFIGVFKEELSKVIYDPGHLEKRKDLPDLWEKMSTVLFENKFPKISDKLLKDVKEIYLPTKHVIYYENGEHEIEIKFIDKEKKLLSIADESSLDIICQDSNISTTYEFGHSISEESTYKLDSFQVDGVEPLNLNRRESQKNGVNFEISSVKLSGKSSYSIKKKDKRSINLNQDNILAFHARKIYYKLKVQIHHDPEIKISLKKAGTLKEFAVKKSKANFKEYLCEGIIYPEQGYYIALSISD